MKAIRTFLPNLCISMTLAFLVIVYLDGRNPMMAFLTSNVSKLYFIIYAAVCLLTAVVALTKPQRRS